MSIERKLFEQMLFEQIMFNKRLEQFFQSNVKTNYVYSLETFSHIKTDYLTFDKMSFGQLLLRQMLWQIKVKQIFFLHI